MIEAMFADHEANDIIKVLHLLDKLSKSDLDANKQTECFKWIDQMYAYYLVHPDKVGSDPDTAVDLMQELLDDVVCAKGYFAELSEIVHEIDRCRRKGLSHAHTDARLVSMMSLAAISGNVCAVKFGCMAQWGIS